MNVSTQRCVVCHKHALLDVPEDGYQKWKNGTDILQALPELDADQRELLISGVHAHCWEVLWEGMDE
jgi:hypothetical protein